MNENIFNPSTIFGSHHQLPEKPGWTASPAAEAVSGFER